MPPARLHRDGYAHWGEDVLALGELTIQATKDPRIANYFARRHVDTADVLAIVSTDRNFLQCMIGKSFKAYSEKRNSVDKLERQMEALNAAASTSKAIFVALATAWFAIIVLSEIGKKASGGDLAILFTAISAAIALGAGTLLGNKRRAHNLSVSAVFSIGILLSFAICSIALPIYFSLVPWRPVGAYIDVAAAFLSGNMLGRDTMIGVRDLAKALEQGCICTFESMRRSKARKRWLDYSLKEVIYPKAILAINDILGEDSTKLLVEQDSDGLRRLQDPKLIISTKSEYRLEHLLGRMDGGSIAVTGPRGAGKSTLLRQICTPKKDPSSPPSIYMSAPSEYVAREFLAELFQQICDTHLQKYDSPIAAMRYRGKRTRRDTMRTARRARTILRIIFRLLLASVLLTVAFWSFSKRIHFSETAVRLPLRQWYNHAVPRVDSFWDKYQTWFRIGALIWALLLWPGKSIRRYWKSILRTPESVRKARNYSIHLKIERTSSWGAGIGLPSVRGTSLSLNKGISEKYSPWSLPEMVGRLREFVEDVSSPGRHYVGPLIIGIDEIDRIGSVEQAERFIGEIKSIFGIPNCFFLVSVAEDIGFIFARRTIIGQSTLEHSFDDVVVVEALEFSEAREMLSTRVPGFTDSFVFLALALSGGLPREIIRVARRLVDINHQEATENYFPRIGDLALSVVAEDAAEVLRTSRSQLSLMSLPESWGAIFYRLQFSIVSLRNVETQPAERMTVISNLCSLTAPHSSAASTAKETEEVAAARVVNGIAAFTRYAVTVVEAFDNEFFDLRVARERMHGITPGSYMELAAARMELGISPKSSQSIIRNFREGIGLSKLSEDSG